MTSIVTGGVPAPAGGPPAPPPGGTPEMPPGGPPEPPATTVMRTRGADEPEPVLFRGDLPAPTSNIARVLHQQPLTEQKQDAEVFHDFLSADTVDLLQANAGTKVYTALLNVTKTNMVMLICKTQYIQLRIHNHVYTIYTYTHVYI